MATPSQSNSFTVPDDVHVIIADKTDTDIYLTIPAAGTATRCTRYVKVRGNNAFVARLTPVSGTIDGQPYWQSSDNNRAIQIVPDGVSDWVIVGMYND